VAFCFKEKHDTIIHLKHKNLQNGETMRTDLEHRERIVEEAVNSYAHLETPLEENYETELLKALGELARSILEQKIENRKENLEKILNILVKNIQKQSSYTEQETAEHICVEREKQDQKWSRSGGYWGTQDSVKLAVLLEEIGEVAEETRETETLEESIQAASVCVAWIEHINYYETV